jgi:hypothetical protein
MRYDKIAINAAAAAALVGLIACGGGGTGIGQPATPAVAPGAKVVLEPTGIAGWYKGTVTDSKYGKGTANFQLTQVGQSAGGELLTTFGKNTITDVVSMVVSADLTAGGSAIALLTNQCSLQITSAYNPGKGVLTGQYSAFRRCTGETGSFTLRQQCYYVTSPLSIVGQAALRPHPFKASPC